MVGLIELPSSSTPSINPLPANLTACASPPYSKYRWLSTNNPSSST